MATGWCANEREADAEEEEHHLWGLKSGPGTPCCRQRQQSRVTNRTTTMSESCTDSRGDTWEVYQDAASQGR